jgi:photosystem II stability/assembly factor-like uncharacterized protein
VKKIILFIVLLICFSKTITAQWQPTEGIYGVGSRIISSDTVSFVQNGSRIYLSTDNGSNWKSINNAVIPLQTTLTCFLKSGANMFLGTQSGVFLSSDNGTNWTQLLNVSVSSLILNGQTIFAGTIGGFNIQ